MGAELTEHTVPGGGLCLKDGRIQAGAAADLFQNEGRVTGRQHFEGAKGSLLVLSDTASMWYLQSRLG